MAEKIDILLFDSTNNIIEEINIEKPNSYKELLNSLKINLKKTILFIRNIDQSDLSESDFSINIKKLDEDKKEKIEKKYQCIICEEHIKNENPYICYQCQVLICEKCLINWDKKKNRENKPLNCPNCRNELPFDKWKKKLDYQEIRKEDAIRMNELNEKEFNKKLNSNINRINENNINELKEENKKLKEENIELKKIIEQFKNTINSLNNNNIHIDELKNQINNIKLNETKNEINLILK